MTPRQFHAEFTVLRDCLRVLCLGGADEFDLHWEGMRQEQDLRRQQRDAKIEECHPDGGHWPPHSDCPLCQKVEHSRRVIQARQSPDPVVQGFRSSPVFPRSINMASQFTEQLFNRDLSPRDFILLCARAMTPLIPLRDEPIDSPLPDQFEPGEYYRKFLAQSHARLALLTDLGEGAFAHAWAENDIKETIKNIREIQHKNDTEKIVAKYTAILAEVEKWNPPTPDHQPLKTFVTDQLKSSLQFDGVEIDYYRGEVRDLTKVEPLVHFRTQFEKAKNDVTQHQSNWDKEVKRTNWRNEWLKTLRDSLPT